MAKEQTGKQCLHQVCSSVFSLNMYRDFHHWAFFFLKNKHFPRLSLFPTDRMLNMFGTRLTLMLSILQRQTSWWVRTLRCITYNCVMRRRKTQDLEYSRPNKKPWIFKQWRFAKFCWTHLSVFLSNLSSLCHFIYLFITYKDYIYYM